MLIPKKNRSYGPAPRDGSFRPRCRYRVDDFAAVGVDANVQFAPGATLGSSMLFSQPFARTAQFQPATGPAAGTVVDEIVVPTDILSRRTLTDIGSAFQRNIGASIVLSMPIA
jgi:hypothetical protein